MKTPEEMAKEWAKQEVPQYHHIDCTPMDRYAHKKAERGFLAGYKAAKDSQEYLMNEMSILRSRLDTAEKLSQLVDENKEQ